MAMTDDEVLLALAPELSTVPAPRRKFFMDAVRPNVAERYGQSVLAMAVAHRLTLAKQAEQSGGQLAAGPITAESEGDLSRSYGQFASGSSGADTPQFWARTQYGLMFWESIRARTFGARNRQV